MLSLSRKYLIILQVVVILGAHVIPERFVHGCIFVNQRLINLNLGLPPMQRVLTHGLAKVLVLVPGSNSGLAAQELIVSHETLGPRHLQEPDQAWQGLSHVRDQQLIMNKQAPVRTDLAQTLRQGLTIVLIPVGQLTDQVRLVVEFEKRGHLSARVPRHVDEFGAREQLAQIGHVMEHVALFGAQTCLCASGRGGVLAHYWVDVQAGRIEHGLVVQTRV